MRYGPHFLLIASALCGPSLHATVKITSFIPSLPSPQALGTPVTWTATATDTHAGPLTFQYDVAYGTGPFALARDFYQGALNAGTWTGPAFTWQTISGEGTYQIEVVAKDFQTGESASSIVSFVLKPLSTGGQFVVSPTSNPLVAIASAPPCPAWSSVRLTIQQANGAPAGYTAFQACNPLITTNIFAAGMLPSTPYSINYQVQTGAKIATGPKPVTFTTGALPSTIVFPTFNTVVPAGPQTDPADQILLLSFLPFNATFLPVATDRTGNILWYYASADWLQTDLLTRPLPGGDMLTLQDGSPWGSIYWSSGEFLREIDLSGNIVRETNLDVMLRQLLAQGAVDFVPCSEISFPASVGAACVGSLHHDAIRLPNGDTAVLTDIEKIFPPGTQGDTSGLNVDIIGDGIVVLDPNFQVLWYFDTFQHDSGAPQLDINRPAVLGETCSLGLPGCPSMYLSGTPGVATQAHDWLHANSLEYNPLDGDIYFSTRHQDWVMKIDYNNGAGTGNILWRLGLDGDFTLTNDSGILFPWFSHQHDANFADPTTGLMVLFDNGNTRVAPPPIGLGGGDSSGYAVTLDQTAMTAALVMRQDLGYYGSALGSAQQLSNGDLFFLPGTVDPSASSYSIEIVPSVGTVNGASVYDLQSVGLPSYRSWLAPSLSSIPTSSPRNVCPARVSYLAPQLCGKTQ